MKTKVLITGLSSTLMSAFAHQIDRDKYEVIGLSRKKEGLDKAFSWINGDLNDLANMPKLLSEINILVHAAALTHVWDEKEYYRVNLVETEKLINAAVSAGVKKVVYVSSRTAGLNSGGYGKSKLLAEDLVKKSCKEWLIFRPSEVFGGSKNEGIEKLIFDAINKKVIFFPAGGEKMYPVDLEDVSSVMYLQAFVENKTNEIVTINGAEGYTYSDLIRKVAKKTGTKKILLPIPKMVMFMIRDVVKALGLKIGMVPDQVDRFYSKKETQEIAYSFKPFGLYIDELINGNLK
ncbi:NAD-dependent epimerase/dehydratase family protein [Arcticibacterium luteifluviistationis]|uniref:NAD-dependent epimerase/dehydratase domain-containing protein n=1 Tax=Arcticibacterium luteifluviistationis TaxID=1784714 RepID=A0A2Z4G9U5_9BACT|nr:NAD(P)-dependent oxidoreductase [Arcticibacterium luteifluviistationis]AWV97860.1 hypothetical protein DJ013_06635 [Arcticibacterium luteifluviistationis]